MNDLSKIMAVYEYLLNIKDMPGFKVEYDNGNAKGYTSYTITKKIGTAEYSDYVIIYDGDEDEENTCICCKDVESDDILKSLKDIVVKANTVIEYSK